MHSLNMCHGGRESRAAGDARADSAAMVAQVLCYIKEKELEATLSEQRGLCAVCHSDTRMPCSLVRATFLGV